MKITCDKCGELKDQPIGIKVGGQKICVKCLAKITVDKMPMPKMEIPKADLERRIEQLEKIVNGG